VAHVIFYKHTARILTEKQLLRRYPFRALRGRRDKPVLPLCNPEPFWRRNTYRIIRNPPVGHVAWWQFNEYW